MNRYIGDYTGKEKGPLLICFGSMHGNEPAGVKALEEMFAMLDREPLKNPTFNFKGRFIGLRGNVKAIEKGQRFIKRDLNRMWTAANVAKVKASSIENLGPEEQELLDIVAIVEKEIADYQPTQVIVLDLHTTTAEGGIFAISTHDSRSVDIGVQLHAPVITGMLDTIEGTTLHYFNEENFGVDMIAVTFESGQHNDPLSINRAIAALTNCMRTIGCVRPTDVENRHDQILREYSKDLPKVAQLLTCHSISPQDKFVMRPGYLNFQPIEKGEVLADDITGEIRASQDCLILMPLYQKQGEDGFFLVKEVAHQLK